MSEPRIIPYGDAALLIQYAANGYSDGVMQSIHALSHMLLDDPFWTEVVAAYGSLLVSFNPLDLDLKQAEAKLRDAMRSVVLSQKRSRLIEIPVVYGGEFGPDMARLMESSGLKQDELIALHTAPKYLVCMMGFVPGFVFLSEAHKKLHHPRHATPRKKVPRGSVGIAGWQTGIYGLETPGGWQIIGRTPASIFDSLRDNPFLVSAGDRIKFVPVPSEEFDD